MRYRDLNGEIYTEENAQDKFLRKLYTSVWGRAMLRPLVNPAFSRAAGAFLNTRLSRVLISPFIRANHLDMTPYVVRAYTSYNDFFTREIKPEARMIDYDESHLVSPSDGKVSAYDLKEGVSFWIKHTQYTLESLTRSRKLAEKYRGGYAVIIRLTVDNYHRYCYPASGRKGRNRFIPGVLHTVNPVACAVLPVYKENAREYTILRTEAFGDVLQMEVGALMVGRICNYHQSAEVRKGQEKGKFEFGGSTIVLLLEKGKVNLREELLRNTREGCETLISMGEWIASGK